jgi:threonine dehydrogenase-like Zn-dependent dehydrogenase
VAVSDVSASRRDLCGRLGAHVVDPTTGDLAGAVADVLGGPATLVLDAVGVDATVADAVAASDFGARIVLVGMGSPRLELAAYAISTEERSLIGSFCYSAREFADTADWVGSVPQGVDALIDGRVGWDGAARSFDELARGRSRASKILVFPQGVDG